MERHTRSMIQTNVGAIYVGVKMKTGDKIRDSTNKFGVGVVASMNWKQGTALIKWSNHGLRYHLIKNLVLAL